MNNSLSENSFFEGKKNLKWFESRIENFNSSVPHQLNVLNSHKSNIRKQYRLENHTAIKQERVAAERVIRHLRQSLIDVEKLGEQIKDCDRDRFDKLVATSRERISSSLKSFNDYYNTVTNNLNNSKVTKATRNEYNEQQTSEESSSSRNAYQDQILLQMNADQWEYQRQLEYAKEVEEIHEKVQCTNEIFRDLAKLVDVQAEHVDKIEENVENSHEHVVSAEKQLAQAAAKVNGAVYPIVGALLGSCLGGPIGFVAGLKIGTVAAVSCSLIGFSGGAVLKSKQRKMQTEILEEVVDKQKTIKS